MSKCKHGVKCGVTRKCEECADGGKSLSNALLDFPFYCPFCGYNQDDFAGMVEAFGRSDCGGFHVCCSGCECMGPKGETMADAISEWNKRVLDKKTSGNIATKFYYWWHNQPGSNTQQGFDEWWDTVKGTEI